MMSFDEEIARGLLREAGVREEVLESLAADASLAKAGLDSLDLANLLLTIEERFGVEIPDEEAARIDSLRALVEQVRRRLR